MEKLLSKELTEDFTEEQQQKALNALKKKKKKLLEFEQIIADMEETDNINLTDQDAKIMSHKDGKKNSQLQPSKCSGRKIRSYRSCQYYIRCF